VSDDGTAKDVDIAKAVAPFWRCPDWCNRGANYRAELDALRARVAELEQSVHDLCFERGALTMERDRILGATKWHREAADGLRDSLRAVRLFVQDCIDREPDATMLGNLYSARDAVDAALNDTPRREALDG
jgi:hypothetical protein